MIKRWQLFVVGLGLAGLFFALGYWQVLRAREKTQLLQTFAQRKQIKPLTVKQLQNQSDLPFYRATLKGEFDNQHTFLLDNKTFHGQVGYEVYTPFYVRGLTQAILVDRGFVPLGQSRATLPLINLIVGKLTLTGLISPPPIYKSWGRLYETNLPIWPLRIEYLSLKELSSLLHYPLFPYILLLEPNHPAAYQMEWNITTMGPKRHQGYAFQWFALSITMLILSIALVWRSKRIR